MLEFANDSQVQMHAAELLDKYGNDSLAYLILEQDKQYFFSKMVEGLIAYCTVGKVAVCASDPICPLSGLAQLLKEFRTYCQKQGLKICFCSISQGFAEVLRNNGFHIAKYGEEALLDLRVYETKGGKAVKLRQKLRRAEAMGIQIIEYLPKQQRDIFLEKKIHGISEEWFANKNSRLTFTLGSLNFEQPLNRRYFLAIGADSEVYAVLVFLPYANGKGYFLDVMRRRFDAVPGVMEKAIIDAGMKMKSEGVEWLSLGLAPLAGIETNDTFLEKSMNFIYQNMNHSYKFQALHDFKKKFAPTCWEPRYIAHERRLTAIKTGYVMIKARNVSGLWQQMFKGFVVSPLQKAFSRIG